ncbi:MAG: RNase adapter RapZ [Candidatus Aminicenantales bacterium]
MTDDRFLVITGLSGSGKTAVSHFLEDLGYYCVDNLPAKLIPIFVELWLRKEVEIEKVALVVDIREHGFLTDFPQVWNTIKRKISLRLIFLDASEETLVQRFSESRRPHPLRRRLSILEGVRLERRRLNEIKKMADEVIDTSSMNILQLRELFTRRFQKEGSQRIQVVVVSFGYKYGVPLDSDLIFDTRFLPNPFYVENLREKTGKSLKVRDYLLKSKETKAFLAELFRFVRFLMPKFIAEGKSHLVISVGCTGGKHRSVIISEKLRDYLKKMKYDIKVYHRDIHK